MSLCDTLKNKRTMLIDDDVWIRNSMRLFFESEGCDLSVCETAEEALCMMRERHFDVILCDYRLPGMDGLMFFRRIRGPAYKNLKILLTAYGNVQVVREALEIGVDEILQKPITSKSLEEAFSRLFVKRPLRG